MKMQWNVLLLELEQELLKLLVQAQHQMVHLQLLVHHLQVNPLVKEFASLNFDKFLKESSCFCMVQPLV